METKEIIDTVATTVENACQMGEPIPQWPDYNVADYFFNGGVGPMTLITLFLIAVLVSAWKAPTWVRFWFRCCHCIVMLAVCRLHSDVSSN